MTRRHMVPVFPPKSIGSKSYDSFRLTYLRFMHFSLKWAKRTMDSLRIDMPDSPRRGNCAQHIFNLRGNMSMRIQGIFTAVAATAGATVLVVAPAVASGSPHFIKNLTNVTDADLSSITVAFKEAGLESGSVETITVTAHLDATYQCVNRGGHNPDDPKKTVVSADYSQSGEFTAAKNGNVVGSLTVTAPAPSSVLDCPSGQTSVHTVSTWSNISVTDEDTSATATVPGAYSFGEPVG